MWQSIKDQQWPIENLHKSRIQPHQQKRAEKQLKDEMIKKGLQAADKNLIGAL